jgi:TolA-binding protein
MSRPADATRSILRRGAVALLCAAGLLGLLGAPLARAAVDGGAGSAATAPPGDGEDALPVRSPAAQAAFEAALKQLAAGKAAEAAAALARLGAEVPDDEVAPEALFEAAQLYDEQLARPDEAQRLYARVASRYPSSRLVRRAENRSAQIASSLRSGAAPLVRFQEILRTTSEGSPERIARLEELVAKEPGFALIDQALYLLGHARLRAGRPDAGAAFVELRRRAPDSEWTARADQAEAEGLLRSRRFDEAQTIYQRLLQRGGPLWSLVAQEGLDRCQLGRRRQLGSYAACGFLLLVGLVHAAGFLRARAKRSDKGLWGLWPPPLEVLYYAPVAGFLIAVSLRMKTGGGALSPSLLYIALGGVLIAWLSGASAQRRPPQSRSAAIASVVLGLLWRALAVLALTYAVLEGQDLLDMVLETARNGPDD